jgi:RNA polymerase sigma-70 factor (ECF subfamily)
MEALSAVLAALPEGQRQCWVLKEMGGYSYEEIAERLDMTTVTVRGKLARARATVVKEMEVWR